MASISIQIPGELGLSDDQVRRLKESFHAQLVETIRAQKIERAAVAPKVKSDAIVVDAATV